MAERESGERDSVADLELLQRKTLARLSVVAKRADELQQHVNQVDPDHLHEKYVAAGAELARMRPTLERAVADRDQFRDRWEAGGRELEKARPLLAEREELLREVGRLKEDLNAKSLELETFIGMHRETSTELADLDAAHAQLKDQLEATRAQAHAQAATLERRAVQKAIQAADGLARMRTRLPR